MSDPNTGEAGSEALPTDDVSDSETGGQEESGGEPLTEDDYALGETSDPGGAAQSEPAGGDYAGSGF